MHQDTQILPANPPAAAQLVAVRVLKHREAQQLPIPFRELQQNL